MENAKFQQRLNDVLDDRQQPQADAELLQMAAQSSDCAERLSTAQLLLDGIELLDRPTVSPSMVDRVIAEVNVGRRQPAHFLRLWMPLCVAAALLLAAIPMYRFWQGGGDENPVAEVKPLSDDDSHEATTPEVPDGTRLVAVDDSGMYIHRAGEAIGEAIWVGSMDQLTPAQEEWVRLATAEIRPVADPMATSLAMTVDAVVRTIEPTIGRP